mgnify:CR=1 FL=1
MFCNVSFADNLKIVDGDTIVLNGEKIRFSGIDTPELKQTCMKGEQKVFCGMFAKMLLIKKIGNETPKCISEGKDAYKRTLAECFINGESLSNFLVRSGYAFAYRKYSKKFVKDEEYAKKIRIGMWAMEFEFPWDFRKNKIADNPSKRCGVELTAKLEGYMVWLTEELPHIEPAINQNCKIHIMNLKELTEKDKKKLKRHEIELSDENNKIV